MDILNSLQPGWNLRLGTQRLVIDAPNEGAAYDLISSASDQACEQNIKNYWDEEEDALAYVKRMLQQQGIFEHSYEALLPYTRAQFSSTFEVIEFEHPTRLKRLVTIHSYELVPLRTMV